jgi:hypothetical protein
MESIRRKKIPARVRPAWSSQIESARERYLPVFSWDRWHTAPPHIRRCLFAAVLAIIGSAQARVVLDGSGTYASRWSELVDCLDTKTLTEIERRSWLWPPAIRNALRRRNAFVTRQNAAFPPNSSVFY